eukprot:gene15042-25306_t
MSCANPDGDAVMITDDESCDGDLAATLNLIAERHSFGTVSPDWKCSLGGFLLAGENCTLDVAELNAAYLSYLSPKDVFSDYLDGHFHCNIQPDLYRHIIADHHSYELEDEHRHVVANFNPDKHEDHERHEHGNQLGNVKRNVLRHVNRDVDSDDNGNVKQNDHHHLNWNDVSDVHRNNLAHVHCYLKQDDIAHNNHHGDVYPNLEQDDVSNNVGDHNHADKHSNHDGDGKREIMTTPTSTPTTTTTPSSTPSTTASTTPTTTEYRPQFKCVGDDANYLGVTSTTVCESHVVVLREMLGLCHDVDPDEISVVCSTDTVADGFA